MVREEGCGSLAQLSPLAAVQHAGPDRGVVQAREAEDERELLRTQRVGRCLRTRMNKNEE